MGEARAALESGQNDAAVATLQKLVRLVPASPEANHLLRLALDASSKENGAAVPDGPATVRLFDDLIRKQQFKEVETRVVEYLKTRPDSWWGHYVLGYALFGQRRVGESIGALSKSLQLNINNADAHRLLGRNLMTIGRFDAAQIELEQTLKLRPQWAEAHYDLAKIYSAHDNYPPAKRLLEETIRLDSSYMEAYDLLGFVMEALGDDNAAVSNYKKATELNESRHGNYTGPYTSLAAYYNRIGEPAKAIQYARKALDLNPKADGAAFQMGRALDRLEKWPEAAEALNRAITSNPN